MGLLPKSAMHVEAGSIRLEGDELTHQIGRRAARDARHPHGDGVPGADDRAQSGRAGRRSDRRGAGDPHRARSRRSARKRVLEIMRSVHLPDPEQMIDAYPHQLSGGQRQRIMIAAALVLDPALLIADEPTTALDVTTQAQILKLVREMQARKKTGVLFITHDFGVVSEIADRVVVMQLGRIVEQGPSEEVLRNPREDYTKMLLAAVPSMTPPKRVPVSGPVVLQTERSVQDVRQAVAAAAEGADRQCRQRCVAGDTARRDARHRRRVRLRQVDGGALRCPAGRADQRRDPHRQCRHRRDEGEEIPPDAAARAVRVPGSLPLAQSAPHRRRSHHRGADEFRPVAR